MTVVCTRVVIVEVQEVRFQVHFEERADMVLCVTKEEFKESPLHKQWKSRVTLYYIWKIVQEELVLDMKNFKRL